MSWIPQIFIAGTIIAIIAAWYAIGNFQLKAIEKIINQIERKPEVANFYDKFIAQWRKSPFITASSFLNGGYYARILKVCNAHSSNFKAWQVLKEIVKRFAITFQLSQGKIALPVFLKSLSKEFNNLSVRNEILEILSLFHLTMTDKTMEFINYWLLKAVVRGKEPKPQLYTMNIPNKIHNLTISSKAKPRINFDLIYFQLYKGEFSVGDTKITYDLNELYEIFKSSLTDGKAGISVNLLPRDLLIYSDNHPRVLESKYLRALYKEFNNIDQDIKKLNDEIEKVSSLIQTIKGSDLYRYQANTYQKGFNLLNNSKLRAEEIKSQYFQFLKERTLSFYLEDVEPNIFRVEDKQIDWETRYDAFKDDYDLLKTMIEEYKQLKAGSWT